MARRLTQISPKPSIQCGGRRLAGTAIRYGVARGVFSNEAGMGSAPIAAAAAKTDHPVRQGLVSMTGTFLDTVSCCSITGIVLVMGILSNQSPAGETGAALTTHTLTICCPAPAAGCVTFGLSFFAYSTILGWCYYGEKCATYLFGDGFVPTYRVIYVVTVMLGTVPASIWCGLRQIPSTA